MAGNYADPTTWRMALDRDGTTFLKYNLSSNAVTDFTTTEVNNVTSEGGGVKVGLSAIGEYSAYMVLIFPEKRDVDAIFIAGEYSLTTIQYSLNSTNGVDGTWVTIAGPYTMGTNEGVWRTGQMAETLLAVKALRFLMGGSAPWNPSVYQVHVWGEIAPGENPDRLVAWSATADEKMPPATLDFGDTPRSSSADKVIRFKNVSPTKAANSIRVAFDIQTDGTPSVPAQFVASYGGGSFQAQPNIGTLAPGAISGPVTIRRITPSNAQYGLYAPRVSAVADTWT